MTKLNRDWAAVARKLASSDLWLEEVFTRGQAWVDLILRARWKPSSVKIRGVRIELDRGQLAISYRALAARWSWSIGKVRRFLDELETDTRIETQKNNVTTVITLLNYDLYQPDRYAERHTNGARIGTQTGTQTGTQMSAPKRRMLKNVKKDPPPPTPSQRNPELAPIAVGGGGGGNFWEAVEARLAGIGIGKIATLVATLRGSANAPSRIGEVIDHWERHGGGQPHAAWSVGMLVYRLEQLTPLTLPTDGWPEPSQAWRKHQSEKVQALTQSVKATRREEIAQQRQREASETADLEARVGTKLDAMSIPEARVFIRQHSDELPADSMLEILRRNKGHPIDSPLVRRPLLEVLDRIRQEVEA